MASSISALSSLTSPSTAATKAASNGTDALANKDTFLKLLVAQIKNQDPLSPSDGAQFVAQLAQFSDLEQSVSMRQDLDAIKNALLAAQPPVSTTSQPTA